MGRFGYFVTADNTTDGQTADAAELLARDRLGHELMYLSRGNPVVYYGDEQGFTGTGGDQLARQTMFASQVPDYQDDTQIGTTRTGADDNFVTDPPALPRDPAPGDPHRPAPRAARRRPAGAARVEEGRPVRVLAGRPATAARVRRRAQQQRAGRRPGRCRRTCAASGFKRLYGAGPAHLTTNRQRRLAVTVPGCRRPSTSRSERIPRSDRAPGHPPAHAAAEPRSRGAACTSPRR